MFNTFITSPYYEISSGHGKLKIFDEERAKQLNLMISYIEDITDKGDYIFVASWNAPPIYALTDTRNPTYYDSLIDLVQLPSEEKIKKICHDIVSKNTKSVITYPRFGFPEKEFSSIGENNALSGCINDNFIKVKNFGNYTIWKRRAI